MASLVIFTTCCFPPSEAKEREIRRQGRVDAGRALVTVGTRRSMLMKTVCNTKVAVCLALAPNICASPNMAEALFLGAHLDFLATRLASVPSTLVLTSSHREHAICVLLMQSPSRCDLGYSGPLQQEARQSVEGYRHSDGYLISFHHLLNS
jgi:hypothetical protein